MFEVGKNDTYTVWQKQSKHAKTVVFFIHFVTFFVPETRAAHV
jgi:hypothetical protein